MFMVYGVLAFAILLLFMLAYYSAFEYSRYKIAKMLAAALGGRAEFRLGKSQMRRHQDGAEERVWVVPDDKMAWGSIFSAVMPSTARLFVQRDADPGFRFHIEPKAGMLWRTISLGGLKAAEFHAPQLDTRLRLRTNRPAEAAAYFSAPGAQAALVALFDAGIAVLKGHHGTIVATMKNISAEDHSPRSIERYFGYLRSFHGLGPTGAQY
jgi:hypothetical protein